MGRIITFEDFEMEDEHRSDVADNTPEPETDTPDTPEDLTDAEPEDLELEEAQPDLDAELDDVTDGAAELEEVALSNKAQTYVSDKITRLKEEGYPDDQAAAIAFSMARKKGLDVNENPNEAETEDYAAPTQVVKPYDDEDEQKIKDVNEKKPRITSFEDHEIDEVRDKTRMPEAQAATERPLDSSYIVDAVTTFAEELKDDVDTEEDLEIAVEMRQVARSMRSQFPSTGDVYIEDAYDIADDQGIEDENILQKVKDQIKYIWAQV